ncbi:MAG: Lrp/AsnC family transcriptional regulator [Candidatus Aenigmarchaeota archaeon]|nr:Lrp/AsnC family transcriptional regulator [Candidatus Aenigmarchaeota archaeon]
MEAKIGKRHYKLREPDDIDRKIINIMVKNARIKLTGLAKEIGLSVDSTKKRLQRLENDKVVSRYTIQVDVDKMGLPLGVHIYVKLKDMTREKYNALIEDLMRNPRVIDLMGMIGDYDLYVVFLAKDTYEMDEMKMELRQKFGSIIGDWKEVVVSKVYKLEEYKF